MSNLINDPVMRASRMGTHIIDYNSSNDADTFKVYKKMHDSDTLNVVDKYSNKNTLRVLEIDTPESNQKGAKYSQTFTKNILETVNYQANVRVLGTDVYGRQLGNVLIKNKGKYYNLASLQVEGGAGHVYGTTGDFAYKLTKLEEKAKREGRGIWREGYIPIITNLTGIRTKNPQNPEDFRQQEDLFKGKELAYQAVSNNNVSTLKESIDLLVNKQPESFAEQNNLKELVKIKNSLEGKKYISENDKTKILEIVNTIDTSGYKPSEKIFNKDIKVKGNFNFSKFEALTNVEVNMLDKGFIRQYAVGSAIKSDSPPSLSTTEYVNNLPYYTTQLSKEHFKQYRGELLPYVSLYEELYTQRTGKKASGSIKAMDLAISKASLGESINRNLGFEFYKDGQGIIGSTLTSIGRSLDNLFGHQDYQDFKYEQRHQNKGSIRQLLGIDHRPEQEEGGGFFETLFQTSYELAKGTTVALGTYLGINLPFQHLRAFASQEVLETIINPLGDSPNIIKGTVGFAQRVMFGPTIGRVFNLATQNATNESEVAETVSNLLGHVYKMSQMDITVVDSYVDSLNIDDASKEALRGFVVRDAQGAASRVNTPKNFKQQNNDPNSLIIGADDERSVFNVISTFRRFDAQRFDLIGKPILMAINPYSPTGKGDSSILNKLYRTAVDELDRTLNQLPTIQFRREGTSSASNNSSFKLKFSNIGQERVSQLAKALDRVGALLPVNLAYWIPGVREALNLKDFNPRDNLTWRDVLSLEDASNRVQFTLQGLQKVLGLSWQSVGQTSDTLWGLVQKRTKEFGLTLQHIGQTTRTTLRHVQNLHRQGARLEEAKKTMIRDIDDIISRYGHNDSLLQQQLEEYRAGRAKTLSGQNSYAQFRSAQDAMESTYSVYASRTNLTGYVPVDHPLAKSQVKSMHNKQTYIDLNAERFITKPSDNSYRRKQILTRGIGIIGALLLTDAALDFSFMKGGANIVTQFFARNDLREEGEDVARFRFEGKTPGLFSLAMGYAGAAAGAYLFPTFNTRADAVNLPAYMSRYTKDLSKTQTSILKSLFSTSKVSQLKFNTAAAWAGGIVGLFAAKGIASTTAFVLNKLFGHDKGPELDSDKSIISTYLNKKSLESLEKARRNNNKSDYVTAALLEEMAFANLDADESGNRIFNLASQFTLPFFQVSALGKLDRDKQTFSMGVGFQLAPVLGLGLSPMLPVSLRLSNREKEMFEKLEEDDNQLNLLTSMSILAKTATSLFLGGERLAYNDESGFKDSIQLMGGVALASSVLSRNTQEAILKALPKGSFRTAVAREFNTMRGVTESGIGKAIGSLTVGTVKNISTLPLFFANATYKAMSNPRIAPYALKALALSAAFQFKDSVYDNLIEPLIRQNTIANAEKGIYEPSILERVANPLITGIGAIGIATAAYAVATNQTKALSAMSRFGKAALPYYLGMVGARLISQPGTSFNGYEVESSSEYLQATIGIGLTAGFLLDQSGALASSNQLLEEYYRTASSADAKKLLKSTNMGSDELIDQMMTQYTPRKNLVNTKNPFKAFINRIGLEDIVAGDLYSDLIERTNTQNLTNDINGLPTTREAIRNQQSFRRMRGRLTTAAAALVGGYMAATALTDLTPKGVRDFLYKVPILGASLKVISGVGARDSVLEDSKPDIGRWLGRFVPGFIKKMTGMYSDTPDPFFETYSTFGASFKESGVSGYFQLASTMTDLSVSSYKITRQKPNKARLSKVISKSMNKSALGVLQTYRGFTNRKAPMSASDITSSEISYASSLGLREIRLRQFKQDWMKWQTAEELQLDIAKVLYESGRKSHAQLPNGLLRGEFNPLFAIGNNVQWFGRRIKGQDSEPSMTLDKTGILGIGEYIDQSLYKDKLLYKAFGGGDIIGNLIGYLAQDSTEFGALAKVAGLALFARGAIWTGTQLATSIANAARTKTTLELLESAEDVRDLLNSNRFTFSSVNVEGHRRLVQIDLSQKGKKGIIVPNVDLDQLANEASINSNKNVRAHNIAEGIETAHKNLLNKVVNFYETDLLSTINDMAELDLSTDYQARRDAFLNQKVGNSGKTRRDVLKDRLRKKLKSGLNQIIHSGLSNNPSHTLGGVLRYSSTTYDVDVLIDDLMRTSNNGDIIDELIDDMLMTQQRYSNELNTTTNRNDFRNKQRIRLGDARYGAATKEFLYKLTHPAGDAYTQMDDLRYHSNVEHRARHRASEVARRSQLYNNAAYADRAWSEGFLRETEYFARGSLNLIERWLSVGKPVYELVEGFTLGMDKSKAELLRREGYTAAMKSGVITLGTFALSAGLGMLGIGGLLGLGASIGIMALVEGMKKQNPNIQHGEDRFFDNISNFLVDPSGALKQTFLGGVGEFIGHNIEFAMAIPSAIMSTLSKPFTFLTSQLTAPFIVGQYQSMEKDWGVVAATKGFLLPTSAYTAEWMREADKAKYVKDALTQASQSGNLPSTVHPFLMGRGSSKQDYINQEKYFKSYSIGGRILEDFDLGSYRVSNLMMMELKRRQGLHDLTVTGSMVKRLYEKPLNPLVALLTMTAAAATPFLLNKLRTSNFGRELAQDAEFVVSRLSGRLGKAIFGNNFAAQREAQAIARAAGYDSPEIRLDPSSVDSYYDPRTGRIYLGKRDSDTLANMNRGMTNNVDDIATARFNFLHELGHAQSKPGTMSAVGKHRSPTLARDIQQWQQELNSMPGNNHSSNRRAKHLRKKIANAQRLMAVPSPRTTFIQQVGNAVPLEAKSALYSMAKQSVIRTARQLAEQGKLPMTQAQMDQLLKEEYANNLFAYQNSQNTFGNVDDTAIDTQSRGQRGRRGTPKPAGMIDPIHLGQYDSQTMSNIAQEYDALRSNARTSGAPTEIDMMYSSGNETLQSKPRSFKLSFMERTEKTFFKIQDREFSKWRLKKPDRFIPRFDEKHHYYYGMPDDDVLEKITTKEYADKYKAYMRGDLESSADILDDMDLVRARQRYELATKRRTAARASYRRNVRDPYEAGKYIRDTKKRMVSTWHEVLDEFKSVMEEDIKMLVPLDNNATSTQKFIRSLRDFSDATGTTRLLKAIRAGASKLPIGGLLDTTFTTIDVGYGSLALDSSTARGVKVSNAISRGFMSDIEARTQLQSARALEMSAFYGTLAGFMGQMLFRSPIASIAMGAATTFYGQLDPSYMGTIPFMGKQDLERAKKGEYIGPLISSNSFYARSHIQYTKTEYALKNLSSLVRNKAYRSIKGRTMSLLQRYGIDKQAINTFNSVKQFVSNNKVGTYSVLGAGATWSLTFTEKASLKSKWEQLPDHLKAMYGNDFNKFYEMQRSGLLNMVNQAATINLIAQGVYAYSKTAQGQKLISNVIKPTIKKGINVAKSLYRFGQNALTDLTKIVTTYGKPLLDKTKELFRPVYNFVRGSYRLAKILLGGTLYAVTGGSQGTKLSIDELVNNVPTKWQSLARKAALSTKHAIKNISLIPAKISRWYRQSGFKPIVDEVAEFAIEQGSNIVRGIQTQADKFGRFAVGLYDKVKVPVRNYLLSDNFKTLKQGIKSRISSLAKKIPVQQNKQLWRKGLLSTARATGKLKGVAHRLSDRYIRAFGKEVLRHGWKNTILTKVGHAADALQFLEGTRQIYDLNKYNTKAEYQRAYATTYSAQYSVAGFILGSMIGGPFGGFVGSLLGSKIGQMIGQRVGLDKFENKERGGLWTVLKDVAIGAAIQFGTIKALSPFIEGLKEAGLEKVKEYAMRSKLKRGKGHWFYRAYEALTKGAEEGRQVELQEYKTRRGQIIKDRAEEWKAKNAEELADKKAKVAKARAEGVKRPYAKQQIVDPVSGLSLTNNDYIAPYSTIEIKHQDIRNKYLKKQSSSPRALKKAELKRRRELRRNRKQIDNISDTSRLANAKDTGTKSAYDTFQDEMNRKTTKMVKQKKRINGQIVEVEVARQTINQPSSPNYSDKNLYQAKGTYTPEKYIDPKDAIKKAKDNHSELISKRTKLLEELEVAKQAGVNSSVKTLENRIKFVDREIKHSTREIRRLEVEAKNQPTKKEWRKQQANKQEISRRKSLIQAAKEERLKGKRQTTGSVLSSINDDIDERIRRENAPRDPNRSRRFTKNKQVIDDFKANRTDIAVSSPDGKVTTLTPEKGFVPNESAIVLYNPDAAIATNPYQGPYSNISDAPNGLLIQTPSSQQASGVMKFSVEPSKPQFAHKIDEYIYHLEIHRPETKGWTRHQKIVYIHKQGWMNDEVIDKSPSTTTNYGVELDETNTPSRAQQRMRQRAAKSNKRARSSKHIARQQMGFTPKATEKKFVADISPKVNRVQHNLDIINSRSQYLNDLGQIIDDVESKFGFSIEIDINSSVKEIHAVSPSAIKAGKRVSFTRSTINNLIVGQPGDIQFELSKTGDYVLLDDGRLVLHPDAKLNEMSNKLARKAGLNLDSPVVGITGTTGNIMDDMAQDLQNPSIKLVQQDSKVVATLDKSITVDTPTRTSTSYYSLENKTVYLSEDIFDNADNLSKKQVFDIYEEAAHAGMHQGKLKSKGLKNIKKGTRKALVTSAKQSTLQYYEQAIAEGRQVSRAELAKVFEQEIQAKAYAMEASGVDIKTITTDLDSKVIDQRYKEAFKSATGTHTNIKGSRLYAAGASISQARLTQTIDNFTSVFSNLDNLERAVVNTPTFIPGSNLKRAQKLYSAYKSTDVGFRKSISNFINKIGKKQLTVYDNVAPSLSEIADNIVTTPDLEGIKVKDTYYSVISDSVSDFAIQRTDAKQLNEALQFLDDSVKQQFGGEIRSIRDTLDDFYANTKITNKVYSATGFKKNRLLYVLDDQELLKSASISRNQLKSLRKEFFKGAILNAIDSTGEVISSSVKYAKDYIRYKADPLIYHTRNVLYKGSQILDRLNLEWVKKIPGAIAHHSDTGFSVLDMAAGYISEYGGSFGAGIFKLESDGRKQLSLKASKLVAYSEAGAKEKFRQSRMFELGSLFGTTGGGATAFLTANPIMSLVVGGLLSLYGMFDPTYGGLATKMAERDVQAAKDGEALDKFQPSLGYYARAHHRYKQASAVSRVLADDFIGRPARATGILITNSIKKIGSYFWDILQDQFDVVYEKSKFVDDTGAIIMDRKKNLRYYYDLLRDPEFHKRLKAAGGEIKDYVKGGIDKYLPRLKSFAYKTKSLVERGLSTSYSYLKDFVLNQIDKHWGVHYEATKFVDNTGAIIMDRKKNLRYYYDLLHDPEFYKRLKAAGGEIKDYFSSRLDVLRSKIPTIIDNTRRTYYKAAGWTARASDSLKYFIDEGINNTKNLYRSASWNVRLVANLTKKFISEQVTNQIDKHWGVHYEATKFVDNTGAIIMDRKKNLRYYYDLLHDSEFHKRLKAAGGEIKNYVKGGIDKAFNYVKGGLQFVNRQIVKPIARKILGSNIGAESLRHWAKRGSFDIFMDSVSIGLDLFQMYSGAKDVLALGNRKYGASKAEYTEAFRSMIQARRSLAFGLGAKGVLGDFGELIGSTSYGLANLGLMLIGSEYRVKEVDDEFIEERIAAGDTGLDAVLEYTADAGIRDYKSAKATSLLLKAAGQSIYKGVIAPNTLKVLKAKRQGQAVGGLKGFFGNLDYKIRKTAKATKNTIRVEAAERLDRIARYLTPDASDIADGNVFSKASRTLRGKIASSSLGRKALHLTKQAKKLAGKGLKAIKSVALNAINPIIGVTIAGLATMRAANAESFEQFEASQQRIYGSLYSATAEQTVSVATGGVTNPVGVAASLTGEIGAGLVAEGLGKAQGSKLAQLVKQNNTDYKLVARAQQFGLVAGLVLGIAATIALAPVIGAALGVGALGAAAIYGIGALAAIGTAALTTTLAGYGAAHLGKGTGKDKDAKKDEEKKDTKVPLHTRFYNKVVHGTKRLARAGMEVGSKIMKNVGEFFFGKAAYAGEIPPQGTDYLAPNIEQRTYLEEKLLEEKENRQHDIEKDDPKLPWWKRIWQKIMGGLNAAGKFAKGMWDRFFGKGSWWGRRFIKHERRRKKEAELAAQQDPYVKERAHLTKMREGMRAAFGLSTGGGPMTAEALTAKGINAADQKLLAMIIVAESETEGSVGQRLVAASMINRIEIMKTGKFAKNTYNLASEAEIKRQIARLNAKGKMQIEYTGSIVQQIIFGSNQYQPVDDSRLVTAVNDNNIKQGYEALFQSFDREKLKQDLIKEGINPDTAAKLIEARSFRVNALSLNASYFRPIGSYKNHTFGVDDITQNVRATDLVRNTYGSGALKATLTSSAQNQKLDVESFFALLREDATKYAEGFTVQTPAIGEGVNGDLAGEAAPTVSGSGKGLPLYSTGGGFHLLKATSTFKDTRKHHGGKKEYTTKWGIARDYDIGGTALQGKTAPTYAAMDARVAYIGVRSGYGLVVELVDINGKPLARYAHLDSIPEGLAIGQYVKPGQLIGYEGRSGTDEKGNLLKNAYDQHTHLEASEAYHTAWIQGTITGKWQQSKLGNKSTTTNEPRVVPVSQPKLRQLTEAEQKLVNSQFGGNTAVFLQEAEKRGYKRQSILRSEDAVTTKFKGTIDSSGRQGNIILHKDAYAAFLEMEKAAAAVGIDLNIISGYRSVDHQAAIIKGKQNQSIGAVLNASAPAGYSEHHTGLAIDINSVNPKDFAPGGRYHKTYQWLKANAEKYGFKLSYPENSKEGAGFEPWHWMYVGKNDPNNTAGQIMEVFMGGEVVKTNATQEQLAAALSVMKVGEPITPGMFKRAIELAEITDPKELAYAKKLVDNYNKSLPKEKQDKLAKIKAGIIKDPYAAVKPTRTLSDLPEWMVDAAFTQAAFGNSGGVIPSSTPGVIGEGDRKRLSASNFYKEESSYAYRKAMFGGTGYNQTRIKGTNIIVTSGFGERNVIGGSKYHPAIDVTAANGGTLPQTNPFALAKVLGFGEAGKIHLQELDPVSQKPTGRYLIFFHSNRRFVKQGQVIPFGTIVGQEGTAGGYNKHSDARIYLEGPKGVTIDGISTAAINGGNYVALTIEEIKATHGAASAPIPVVVRQGNNYVSNVAGHSPDLIKANDFVQKYYETANPNFLDNSIIILNRAIKADPNNEKLKKRLREVEAMKTKTKKDKYKKQASTNKANNIAAKLNQNMVSAATTAPAIKAEVSRQLARDDFLAQMSPENITIPRSSELLIEDIKGKVVAKADTNTQVLETLIEQDKELAEAIQAYNLSKQKQRQKHSQPIALYIPPKKDPRQGTEDTVQNKPVPSATKKAEVQTKKDGKVVINLYSPQQYVNDTIAKVDTIDYINNNYLDTV